MDNETYIVTSHDVRLDGNYADWLRDLKSSYRQAQIKASVKVNNERLAWYWRTGRDLVIRKAEQTWGSGVVEQLSLDLRNEFPNESGLSADNLWAMKRWYLFYAKRFADGKLAQAAQELLVQPVQVLDDNTVSIEFPAVFGLVPWGHHLDIIRKTNSLEEAFFYIQKTVAESLSRPTLQRIIAANLYQNHGGAITNFNEQLPDVQAKLAQEITKENYDFAFVTLPSEYDERDLETQLEQQISRFLLELGNGFSFVGRQKEIVVDGVSRRIDMKQTEVKYSFLGLNTPIGVAKYNNVQIEEIAKQLPTVEQLQERIKMLEDELRRKAEERKA